jgi:signal transduction histidine kinase
LIEAERMEAVSTFAAGVAHEVRNPLQGIILSIDYLASCGGGEDPNTTTVLARMRSAVARINEVITGLVEFAVKREHVVQHEDLNRIVESALKSVENELNAHPIRLRTDLAENLPPLELDARTLRHVFITLLMNSIRELSEGGTLAVRTYARGAPEDGGATVGLPAPGKVVVAEFCQRHHPVLTENLEAEQTQSQDRPESKIESGLGLKILRKILGAYGGTIDHAQEGKTGNVYKVQFKG